MMNNKFKKVNALICALLLAASTVCATGCGNSDDNTADTTESVSESVTEESTDASTEDSSDSEDTSVEMTVLGEGETQFYFDVITDDGSESYFEINTDETTVGDALVALDLIAGEESDYGLYVTTVNGVTVDYDTDGKYWAFYIDGEYASTGVDSTDITAGSTYTFQVEEG